MAHLLNIRKYLKPSNYYRAILLLLNRTMLPLFERLMFKCGNKELKYPPIFIVGAPRSGSTLLMQVLTQGFNLGYLSNSHAKWFGAPALHDLFSVNFKNNSGTNFESNFGVTGESFGPSECGEWWYRFFRRSPSYVEANEVSDRNKRLFRHSIITQTNMFKKPVIYKNLYAGLRLKPLVNSVPEALFIFLRREPEYNALSLLRTREIVFGDSSKWWSIKPPGYEKTLQSSPHEQVLAQVDIINTLICRDLELLQIEKKRIFEISYEDLCSDPVSQTSRFFDFLKANDIMVEYSNNIPNRFSRNVENSIVGTDLEIIKRHVENNRHGRGILGEQ